MIYFFPHEHHCEKCEEIRRRKKEPVLAYRSGAAII